LEHNTHCAPLASWWEKKVRPSKRKTAEPKKPQKMKKSEIGVAVTDGRRLVVGVYTSQDIQAGIGKKSQKPYLMHHAMVANGNDLMKVGIRTPDGATKREQVKPLPYKPGEKVVVEWKSWEAGDFGLEVRGELHPLED
jgi:hypothetical protein